MDDRLKNLNKKIIKSTIQIQKLMSQLVPSDRPSANSFRSRIQMKDNEVMNPEESNKKLQSRVMGQPLSNKSSNVETNASSKFQESRERFNSFKQMSNTQQSRQRGFWVCMSPQHVTQREINKNTKFAIGNTLYPTKNFQQSFSNQKTVSQTDISKIRSQAISAKNIFDIDYNYVLNYALSRQPLTETSKPQQIFDYFIQFATIFKKPLIKKYKNCLYFGESQQHNNYRIRITKYMGFLYFFALKIYYGSLQQEYKHGLGVQINLKNGAVYKGNFNKGHKVGKFQVICGDKFYQGQLSKGKFHGQGKLQTPISIYSGLFYNGMRHGEGQQFFFKSGLILKGIFQMDKFCNDNNNNNTPDRNMQLQMTKKIQIKQQRQYKPYARNYKFAKLNNMFDFSFHDSSQEQESIKKKSHIKWTTVRKRNNLQKNLQKFQNSQLESASDDDPLPSPFRKVIRDK